MGGNNEVFENFERNKYLKKLPSMQRVNEYFIESLDILKGHLTDGFNKAFDSSYFLEIWSKG